MLPFLPEAIAAAPVALRGGHWRLRGSMYLAFTALAVAVCLQGLSTLRLEEARAADAEILDKAGLLRTLSQHIGLEAALVAGAADNPALRTRHADALSVVMAQSSVDALHLETLLTQEMQRSSATARQLLPALESWQAARERLWYRTETLLRVAEGGAVDRIEQSAAAVLAETAPTLEAARKLTANLRSAAELRAEGLRDDVQWGIGALLFLLGLLSVTVVEPTARAVRLHVRRLDIQAAELQRLALVAEHTAALVVITDRDDRVLWVNPSFTSVTGWTLAEARGQRPDTLLRNPHADLEVLAQVQRAVALHQGARHEWMQRSRDGDDIWLDVDLRPLQAEDGAHDGYVRVCSDTTARVQQQAKLQALWAVLSIGVVVQSLDGSVVEANRGAERLLGLTTAQLQAGGMLAVGWQAVHEDLSACPASEFPALRTLASGLPLHNQTIGLCDPTGVQRWLLVNTELQRDVRGQLTGVLSCFSDITERRTLQDRLLDTARTDALTRLPNRCVVLERLQRALLHARNHPGYGFAVLLMDFDRFKQINDTLGYAAGDELLRQIAQRLTHTLRPGDAVARLAQQGSQHAEAQIAARLGGDEFVIVLEGVNDLARAAAIAERLLQELTEPYLIGCNPVQCSASIGVVLCKGRASAAAALDELKAEELLRHADTAMYEAKRAGRGRVVMFDDSMHERVLRALALEHDLRLALKTDELFVVYQPVLELASRRMVAVEALVRWRHPLRGLVLPVEFIGLAEECGLIDAVGERVLRQACAQFMDWQHRCGAAAPAQLAVNLSRAQLVRASLVDEVREVLQASGMSPGQLQFEVTESLAAQDERVLATLRELKGLGVRLALDDFGTGYSSLACLHQMPVDTVKIDRSFVSHAETVEYHRVLIEATIRVALTLGMTTVAEGIETEGQAALMLELACDRGQGFLYSRPLDAAALEAWMLAQPPQDGAVAEAGVGAGEAAVAAIKASRHGALHSS